MIALRWVTCLALVALVACQPLYGGKPEAPPKVQKKKRPDVAADVEKPVVYVEECNAQFTDDPKKAQHQTTLSRQLVDGGDTALAQADKSDKETMKISLWKEAIDKYRNALIKDPYNADATLKLALAYDRVLRKGCALAMLKRLALMSNTPRFQSEANRQIDSLDANASWFKGYRKDAMTAVGR